MIADQERSLWRQDEIRIGLALVEAVAPGPGCTEELRLQGLIAAEHARAALAGATDWRTIAELYGRLELLTQSPVVRLNRAIAVAEADGATAGLALLVGLDQALPHSHRVPAVRADLARRAGDLAVARVAHTDALAACGNAIEREYLAAQLASLDPRGC